MRLWVCRILVGLVLLDNLQAAIQFIMFPRGFAAAFDLAGPAGITAIRSVGILFLMWCVPYGFAAYHPIRYRGSLIEASMMQAIGLIGETLLRMNLPSGLVNTPVSLERFVLFDAVGLGFLLGALWLSLRISPWKTRPTG